MCLGLSGVLAVGYADFNRDGREDLLRANISGTKDTVPIEMFLQDSAGRSVLDNSMLPSPPPGSVHARKIVVADFNGDGRPDAFIADHGYDQPPFPGAVSFLLLSVDKAYVLAEIPDAPIGFQHSATAADINGDGAPDILVTDTTNGAFLLVNDGTGRFTLTRRGIPAIRDGYYTSELIDLDDDGYYDLLVGGHEQDGAVTRVLWGDPAGTFTTSRSTSIPPDADYRIVLDFDAEDLDGDGARELVLTRTKSSPFYQGYYFQMLEMSARGFTDVSVRIVPDRATWEGSTARWVAWITLRDFNGDAVPDIVVVDTACTLVYLGDGRGAYARQR